LRVKKERSLLSRHDCDYHDLSIIETNKKQQEKVKNMNGLTPYAMIPQPYWNPSVGQISYVQQPPVAYYQPYDYQAIQPQYPLVLASPPTPVSKTPTNKPSGPLPFAPLGRTRQESNIVYTSLGIAPQPIVPPLIPQAVIPAPIPQVIIPAPIPPPIIPRILLPPQPIYYHRHSSLSPYYHHDRSSLPPYVTLFLILDQRVKLDFYLIVFQKEKNIMNVIRIDIVMTIVL
jgi:hypothetical protein